MAQLGRALEWGSRGREFESRRPEFSTSLIKKLLIVRQDNIGDLVCTTPLIAGIRAKFPDLPISVLCTSYNCAVLERNPDVSAVFVYSKRSHHGSVLSLIRGSVQKVLLIWRLRRKRFDVVIAASTPCGARVTKLVRMINPARFLRSSEDGGGGDDLPPGEMLGRHEVERVWGLGKAIGLSGEPPAVRVYPDSARSAGLRTKFLSEGKATRLVAVHISSRKPSQQWPTLHFAKLLRELHRAEPSLGFLILWAPGSADQRGHSGDDEKARDLANELGGTVPVVFCPTPDLEGTIEALAACDFFIGSDGGAMHLAAACGLPVVALFGASDVQRWYPWTACREVLQAESREVRDIAPEKVAAAFARLAANQGAKNAGSK